MKCSKVDWWLLSFQINFLSRQIFLSALFVLLLYNLSWWNLLQYCFWCPLASTHAIWTTMSIVGGSGKATRRKSTKKQKLAFTRMLKGITKSTKYKDRRRALDNQKLMGNRLGRGRICHHRQGLWLRVKIQTLRVTRIEWPIIRFLLAFVFVDSSDNAADDDLSTNIL